MFRRVNDGLRQYVCRQKFSAHRLLILILQVHYEDSWTVLLIHSVRDLYSSLTRRCSGRKAATSSGVRYRYRAGNFQFFWQNSQRLWRNPWYLRLSSPILPIGPKRGLWPPCQFPMSLRKLHRLFSGYCFWLGRLRGAVRWHSQHECRMRYSLWPCPEIIVRLMLYDPQHNICICRGASWCWKLQLLQTCTFGCCSGTLEDLPIVQILSFCPPNGIRTARYFLRDIASGGRDWDCL